VKLVTYVHTVTRLRMSTAVSLIPQGLSWRWH
jgi:hypothetical protein